MAFSSTMAAKSNTYCSGKQFGTSNAVCGKFQFNKLKTSGQCTDSNKKAQGQFHGVKLSNCTTYVICSKREPHSFILSSIPVSMILASYQVKQ